MGNHVQHRTNKDLNNRLEQDHRDIKQRYYPMRGFGTFEAAARFGYAFGELPHSLRPHRFMGETISLSEQRRVFLNRFVALHVLRQAAS
ncbi:hypothetical protein KSB_63190 [Ktedonobacter robiniae]|uniref:DDE domain-containing protein n=1 Tax=Ktedonobacter robiniae TaxID=2778365 RepID=A0ABQ3UY81_9CHLR|nr:hypothetical protein KSB_63190 [Ktedonobacter robiniae]